MWVSYYAVVTHKLVVLNMSVLSFSQNVNRNMRTKSSDGREFYLVEVIAFVLKHLKCRFECHLSSNQPSLTGADFDWVITVPAIWRACGKQMMREAAYMVNNKKLLFEFMIQLTLSQNYISYRQISYQLIQESLAFWK